MTMRSTRPASAAAGETEAAFAAWPTTTAASDRASEKTTPERSEAMIDGAKAMEA
jgi:hypothetical protein